MSNPIAELLLGLIIVAFGLAFIAFGLYGQRPNP